MRYIIIYSKGQCKKIDDKLENANVFISVGSSLYITNTGTTASGIVKILEADYMSKTTKESLKELVISADFDSEIDLELSLDNMKEAITDYLNSFKWE